MNIVAKIQEIEARLDELDERLKEIKKRTASAAPDTTGLEEEDAMRELSSTVYGTTSAEELAEKLKEIKKSTAVSKAGR